MTLNKLTTDLLDRLERKVFRGTWGYYMKIKHGNGRKARNCMQLMRFLALPNLLEYID